MFSKWFILALEFVAYLHVNFMMKFRIGARRNMDSSPQSTCLIHGIDLLSHLPAWKRIDGFFNTIGIYLIYLTA